MLTQCNSTLFDFAPVEHRSVVASFDGGCITTDAGALLLGASDRVLVAPIWQNRRAVCNGERYPSASTTR